MLLPTEYLDMLNISICCEDFFISFSANEKVLVFGDSCVDFENSESRDLVDFEKTLLY